jgi:hypothetical protein
MFGNKGRLERKLSESGRSAAATVVDCKSGMKISTGPAAVSNSLVICKLTLQVMPDGETGFEASTSEHYGQFRIPRPGDTVRVLYDAEDHNSVVIDHTEAAASQDVVASRVAHFRARNTELGTAIANQLEAESVPGGRLQRPANNPAAISAFGEGVDAIIREAKARMPGASA